MSGDHKDKLNTPILSVISSVYNVKKEYLSECVNSLLQQTLKDIEIILVDDGSESSIADYCDELSLRDNRIRVIHQENQGTSIAQNNGISLSNGKYITFVDDDDWADSNMCKRAVEHINETKADISFWMYKSATADKIFNGYYQGPSKKIYEGKDIIELESLIMNPQGQKQRISLLGANWCKIYKTDFLKDNSIRFPERIMGGEDAVFFFRALKKARRVSFFEDYLYYYRQNSGSYTKRFNPNLPEVETRTLEFYKELSAGVPELEKAYKNACCTSIISIILGYILHSNNKDALAKKKNELREILNKPCYKYAVLNYRTLGISKSKKVLMWCLKHRSYNLALMLAKAYQLINNEGRFS